MSLLQCTDMDGIVPLFKSHYSLGKSILTLSLPDAEYDSEGTKDTSDSIFEIALDRFHHNDPGASDLFLVDDCMSGFLEAYTNTEKINKAPYSKKLKLIFGLRLTFCPDMNDKSEEVRKDSYKNIIFVNNVQGYKQLIKIWTTAAQDGFYYEPRIDFKTLKEFWTKDLLLGIPFYDSFLHRNNFTVSSCIPDFSYVNKPVFFIEDNDTLIDSLLADKVREYCKDKYDVQKSKSIYYKNDEDFDSYLTFKCINKRTTVEKPNFDGMCSNNFSYESYRRLVNG